MVLSDIEISAEIRAKRLRFDPPIDELSGRIDSSALDLQLHEELIILPEAPVPGVIIATDAPRVSVMELLNSHGKPHSLLQSPYTLKPHHFIIGKTLENITLPDHLSARIEGKSTLARLGLSVHVTAPTVMAGFEGHLYLEMNNIGPFSIQLERGMKIAQLVLEHVGLPPSKGYQGRYQQQR